MDPEEIVRRFWLEMWGGMDVAVMDSLFGEHCVRHNREGTETIPLEKLKESFVRYRATFADAATVRIDDLSARGDRVWSRTTVRWLDTETASERTISFLQLARIDQGRIVETWSLAAPEVDWGRSDA